MGSGECRPAGDRPALFLPGLPALPLDGPAELVPRLFVVRPNALGGSDIMGGGLSTIGYGRFTANVFAGAAICPSPPTYEGPSSSSSTQSDSSPMVRDGRPVNTSRIPLGTSGAGKIASTSTAGCAARVCHPGGSIPQDFFQLERPMELR